MQGTFVTMVRQQEMQANLQSVTHVILHTASGGRFNNPQSGQSRRARGVSRSARGKHRSPPGDRRVGYS